MLIVKGVDMIKGINEIKWIVFTQCNYLLKFTDILFLSNIKHCL